MKKVLFVCTGNTCRSPMAAALMNSLGLPIKAESAGLFADGSPYSEKSIGVLSEIGITLFGNSRQLTRNDLTASIIFCMSDSHRDILINLGADREKIRVLDIPDPYGGNTDAYRACRDEIFKKLSVYKYSVRRAVREDAEKAAVLEKECFSAPWSLSALESAFESGTDFFAAENEKGIIGYAAVNTVLDEAYIYNIAVSPMFRGFGVGTALTEALISCAAEKGAGFISLEVRESNSQAVSIYERLGFERAGKRKNFYSEPLEDGLIMTKVIDNEDTQH